METTTRLLPTVNQGLPLEVWMPKGGPIPGSFFTLDDFKPQALPATGAAYRVSAAVRVPVLSVWGCFGRMSPFFSFPMTPSPASRVPAAAFGVADCSVSRPVKFCCEGASSDTGYRVPTVRTPCHLLCGALGVRIPLGFGCTTLPCGVGHKEPEKTAGWLVALNVPLCDR